MAPVLQKLRYREGMRVVVEHAPLGFETALETVSVTRVRPPAKNADLVQAFFTRLAHLERELPKLTQSLAPGGILWLCYPKAKALETDLNRDIIRELVATRGLEAVAIVAIDPVWSALRCKVTHAHPAEV